MKLCGILPKVTVATCVCLCLLACGGKTGSDALGTTNVSSGGSRPASTSMGGDNSGGMSASSVSMSTGGDNSGGVSASSVSTSPGGDNSGGMSASSVSMSTGGDNSGGVSASGVSTSPGGGNSGGVSASSVITSVVVTGGSTAGGFTSATAGTNYQPFAPMCSAGSKGCLCDSMGHCAEGLTCTMQTGWNLGLCCNGTDCAAATASAGAICNGDAGTAAYSTGVTIPAASGTNDNCGYPASSFRESVIMCGVAATGGGLAPARIQVFYNDEHALTLGCATSTFPVSPLLSNPEVAYYPQTGDPNCIDSVGRPMRPVLYVSDITSDPNCRAGDQQQGGTPYDPVAVFGAWKPATMGAGGYGYTSATDPLPMNLWDLGTAADPIPASAAVDCPCTASSCVTAGHAGRGYAAEVLFEVGLIAGHAYRIQVIMQDGDMTTATDAGEICAIFCPSGIMYDVPLTCSDLPVGTCGLQSDGLGGVLDCGPCSS